jgi:photosystem II oxygen-evolving enhancer protein 2
MTIRQRCDIVGVVHQGWGHCGKVWWRYFFELLMLRRIARLLVTLLLIVQIGAAPAQAASLKGHIDTLDGYKFLYPNGWVEVPFKSDADTVYHDLIEPTENVSVIISQVPGNKKLVDLGTPTEVGFKLGKSAIAPAGSGREAELTTAESEEIQGKTYYYLEYLVKVGEKQRYNLASVVVSRGKLFTCNASTTARRWPKMKKTLTEMIHSFNVA